MTNQPITLQHLVTPPTREPHGDLRISAEEYRCPAIWNGTCESCDTCWSAMSQVTIVSPSEGDTALQRITPDSDPVFTCPTNWNGCLRDECPAFWWEGVEAGCSLEPVTE